MNLQAHLGPQAARQSQEGPDIPNPRDSKAHLGFKPDSSRDLPLGPGHEGIRKTMERVRSLRFSQQAAEPGRFMSQDG